MANQNCFVCRIMRALAFSGLGGGLAGYGALFMGAGKEQAVYWALGGALLAVVLMRQREMKKKAG